jgi:CheY-like chemotaxis protein
MRFLSELSLLLILTLSPLLILGGLSLRFTIPGVWLLLAGGIGVMAAMTTTLRLRHRFVRPLRTLIDNLYENVETPRGGEPPELRQLLRAIRFSSAAGNVDAMNRVSSLEQQLQSDRNIREQDDLLLKQEREVLRETQREIIDATNDLEVQKLLARETARKLFAVANSSPLNSDAVTELENLQFLLSDSHYLSATENHDLLRLMDRVISITAPLSRKRNTAFHVAFDPDCPRHFVLDDEQFASCLFQLVIRYLQLSHLKPGDLEPIDLKTSDRLQEKQRPVFIRVSQTTGGFTLTFPETVTPMPGAGLDENVTSTGATRNSRTLTFPATLSHQKMSVETGLTAIVVVEDEYLRSSLARRLGFVGVTCTTDFKNQHLDICVVADETSDVFLAIQPYLPETTFVLMLNNRQHYQHPHWITVKDPVTQIQLEKIVARITDEKGISNRKNVLVVDDSEVNIQLLEIQLNELGHSVTIAGTGEIAVTLAKNHRFELIFMDIQMPGIDGLEATRRIRQYNRSVPIVGLTAHATTEEKKECLEAGMNDVLIKPVRMESLSAMTHRLGQPGAFLPLAASGTSVLPIFDLDLTLANANNRHDLAAELFELLLAGLPGDLDTINAASNNIDELKRAVHKLHGAVRYCGVPRLAGAIGKLESALKQDNDSDIRVLLNLLNGEVTALNAWHQDNPDVLGAGDQQIKRR